MKSELKKCNIGRIKFQEGKGFETIRDVLKDSKLDIYKSVHIRDVVLYGSDFRCCCTVWFQFQIINLRVQIREVVLYGSHFR